MLRLALDQGNAPVALQDDVPASPADAKPRNEYYERLAHYHLNTGPTHEFADLPETPATIRNVGWTLGNDCPYRCKHCYSMSARQKGRDMSKPMIDRIVGQLRSVGVETVNLGGNEPLFTNGPDPKNTLLPYIIHSLADAGIEVGLTTSGISALRLSRDHPDAFDLLNDVDVSFDSPFEDEHNSNRGAAIFDRAVQTLRLCKEHLKPHGCIMAGMRWNFTPRHVDALVALAAEYDANVRINPLKPVEPHHMELVLTPQMFYAGLARLLELCEPVDLGEPAIAAVTEYRGANRCPCGRTSFRIHSITPTGEIYVSPCVYLHDYKSDRNLLEHDLGEIIRSPQFVTFRQRNANPDRVTGCAGCEMVARCGGGCTARAYLHNLHETRGEKTMLARDPYCAVAFRQEWAGKFPRDPQLAGGEHLVHMDYLCTWIGRPKSPSSRRSRRSINEE